MTRFYLSISVLHCCVLHNERLDILDGWMTGSMIPVMHHPHAEHL